MTSDESSAAADSILKFNIIQVRAASQVPILKKWFPMALQGQPPASFFVAMEPSTQTLIGGASLRILREYEQQLHGRFQVFVRPDMRRNGIGTKLVEVLRRRTARAQAELLLAGYAVAEDDPSTPFFKNIGMEPKRSLGLFEVDDLVNNKRIARILDHYQERRGTPDNMELVPMSQARPAYVRQFVLRHLGGLVGANIGIQPYDPSGIAPHLSFVVRNQQGIIGVIIGRVQEPKVAAVAAVAVLPGHRGGWVNLALRHHFQEACIQYGLEKIRYEADFTLHPDSIQFARRNGFELIQTRHFYGCDIVTTKETNNEPQG